MTPTYAQPIRTARHCDCGARATYRLDIAIGGHNQAPDVRTDTLYLCPACYVIQLEMEIECLVGEYRPSPAAFTDLAAIVRRYIKLEQAYLTGVATPATPRQRREHINEARRVLCRLEGEKVPA